MTMLCFISCSRLLSVECKALIVISACHFNVQAVAQLGMDPAANPGAKMLARMGFGTTGGCTVQWEGDLQLAAFAYMQLLGLNCSPKRISPAVQATPKPVLMLPCLQALAWGATSRASPPPLTLWRSRAARAWAST